MRQIQSSLCLANEMGQFESGVAAKLLGVVRSVVLEEP